jgi:hypothetical protein
LHGNGKEGASYLGRTHFRGEIAIHSQFRVAATERSGEQGCHLKGFAVELGKVVEPIPLANEGSDSCIGRRYTLCTVPNKRTEDRFNLSEIPVVAVLAKN